MSKLLLTHTGYEAIRCPDVRHGRKNALTARHSPGRWKRSEKRAVRTAYPAL